MQPPDCDVCLLFPCIPVDLMGDDEEEEEEEEDDDDDDDDDVACVHVDVCR
jgi:hypothetical protein